VKVALVILHADASRGGAERYTLDLAEGLVRRGHDVSIWASSFQDKPTAGKRVLVAAGGLTRTGKYDSFNAEVIRADLAQAPDVIHAMLPVFRCDIYHPHAGIAAEGVSRGHLNKSGNLRRAIAWLGNQTNLRRRRFAAVERKILANSQRRTPMVFCLSNLIKERVKRQYPTVSDEKLVSLFNGIDLTRFNPESDPRAKSAVRKRFGLADDALVALMLAQDFERKGLAQAIRALAMAQNPKVFLLVGGKPDPTKYKKLAFSLCVADRVIFAGAISNPADFYLAADFFVLPTRFDPCSLVVLEALAMGLPVISTSKNGACEVMQDGVHGRVLADPDDVPALADAMREIMDPSRRVEIAQACLQLRPILSQEAHLDKVEKQYRRVLANSTVSERQ
jgi:UDP-glucose:(heptosyl)LPS alpha-1,3-glucosyltransferase